MENALAQSTSEDLDAQIKEDIMKELEKEMLQSPAQTLNDSLLSMSDSMQASPLPVADAEASQNLRVPLPLLPQGPN